MNKLAVQLPQARGRDRSFDLLRLYSASVLLLLALLNFIIYLSWDFDDSYIVYRIVSNILNGRGWVYNVGESHNASTSVLNTLLITLLAWPGGRIQLAAHVVSGLAILGSSIVAYTLFRQRFYHPLALLAGVLIVLMMSQNNTWGLETNLFIFLILLFVLNEKNKRNSWPLLGLAILTRPDAAVLAGLKWLRAYQGTRRYSGRGLITVFTILAPWFLFSLYYFQQLFPDTLSAKVWQGYSGYWGTGPVFLKGLLAYYLADAPWRMGLVLVGAGAGIMFMVRDRSAMLYFVAFVCLQNLVYIFLNVPPYTWYFAPTNVVLLLAILYLVGVLGQRMRYRTGIRFLKLAGYLLPFLLGLYLSWQNQRSLPFDARIHSYIPMIEKIDAALGPGELAMVEVGMIGYYTNRPILDLTGLVSSSGQYVSPNRMDAFYERAPQLLLLHDPVWSYENSIVNDYRFPFLYRKSISQANLLDPNYSLQLYERQDDYDMCQMNAALSDIYPSFQPDSRFVLEELLPLPRGKIHLDLVNGYLARENRIITHQRSVLHVQGWAVDRSISETPEDVLVVLRHEDNSFYSVAAERMERLDAARYLKDENAYRMAGFVAMAMTLQLPPGAYELYIAQEVNGHFYSEKVDKLVIQFPSALGATLQYTEACKSSRE
jgi:arabinofuranosyltransferase